MKEKEISRGGSHLTGAKAPDFRALRIAWFPPSLGVFGSETNWGLAFDPFRTGAIKFSP